MMRIGHVQLATNVLLAPVAGHCDLPLRLTVRRCGGVGLAFTDLLCPHGVLKQNAQTRWLMATCDDDRPLGMQLYGREPDLMCEAARWALGAGATTIDINMGCPVDKVTKTFAGSMMLCIPDHTVAMAERLVRAVGDRVPVTAKLRLGYHDGELTAPALARRLVGVGVSAITIHGRTAAQRFKGGACLDGIAAVVAAVHEAGDRRVPCIGNGDIRTPFDAAAMVEHTGCDGVMIARAALGCPWIIRDTAALLATGRIGDELTLRQRLDAVRFHFDRMLALRATRRQAVMRMRQVIGGYGPHLGPCRDLKRSVMALTEDSADSFGDVFDRWLASRGEAADRVSVTWEQRRRQLASSQTQPEEAAA